MKRSLDVEDSDKQNKKKSYDFIDTNETLTF